MDFHIAAGEAGQNLFTLTRFSDQAFEELIGPTAAKYGWGHVRVVARTQRIQGLSAGPAQVNYASYHRNADGEWFRSGAEDSHPPLEIIEARDVQLEGSSHRVEMYRAGDAYVLSAGGIGYVEEYQCLDCDGDIGLTARLIYRLMLDRYPVLQQSDETAIELRVFSSRRLSNWHYPPPVLLWATRSNSESDWPRIDLSENAYVDLMVAQMGRYQAEGRVMREQAEERLRLQSASNQSDPGASVQSED